MLVLTPVSFVWSAAVRSPVEVVVKAAAVAAGEKLAKTVAPELGRLT